MKWSSRPNGFSPPLRLENSVVGYVSKRSDRGATHGIFTKGALANHGQKENIPTTS